MNEIKLKGHEGIIFRANDGKLPKMFFFLELTKQGNNPPEVEFTLASAVKLGCLSKTLADKVRSELGILESQPHISTPKDVKLDR